ncbi:MAG TPA: serine hydrolase domain-containing protein [Hyphomicrobiaceae bacterium]|nr:serine hydrolase domain-containing protein [Hyphomicrobiaceae bacterium]
MTRSISMKGLCALALMMPLAMEAQADGKDPLPRADPASVGLSPERLARIAPVFKSEIEKGRIPGVVLAVARRGKLAYFEAIGAIDPATKAPMTTDALFSIASMTKPMVSVGIMMLAEEGKLFLNDPVGQYLPQLKDMKVALVKKDAEGKEVVESVPAKRQPTIQDLLRHTSGVTYGGRGNTAVHKMWPRGSAVAATQFTGPEFLETIGKLPLLHEPGTVWDYSLSVDILGQVIEAISGKPLSAFLAERIWQPLGMVDTSFAVPEDKKARYARAFPNDPITGKPQTVLHAGAKPVKFECGGGCGVSTASDYIRFSQMLLNGGVLDGKRLLGKKTVAYMTSNHLGPGIENNVAKTDPSREGYGFGLGFAVRLTPGIAGVSGSEGDYNWGGAYGTFFWNDPKEELTVVFMSQGPGPIRTYYRKLVNALVLQAIVE